MGYSRETLARLIAEKRGRDKLSVRGAAATIGMSPATLNRIENHDAASGENLFKILVWLDVPVTAIADSPREEPAALFAHPQTRADDDQHRIEVHLRAARHLDPKTTAAIAEAFRCVASLLESRSDE